MGNVVRDFYDASVEREWNRLDWPYTRIEFQSTLHLIERYFPPAGHIIDVGGGPGRYALELLRRGYDVTLLDLSDNLLAFARHQVARERLQAEAVIQGDARDLSHFEDGTFDAALLLGPLYHITQPEGRAQALSEARRVLKPGGVALVAYINTWAVLRVGIRDFPAFYRDEAEPRRRLAPWSQGGQQKGFTEAYFTTPPAALDEVQRAGFDVLTYIGAEGCASCMGDAVNTLAEADPPAYANLLKFAVKTCDLPQFRDLGEHLIIVARKG